LTGQVHFTNNNTKVNASLLGESDKKSNSYMLDMLSSADQGGGKIVHVTNQQSLIGDGMVDTFDPNANKLDKNVRTSRFPGHSLRENAYLPKDESRSLSGPKRKQKSPIPLRNRSNSNNSKSDIHRIYGS
jgi:hypothetical protein